MIDARRDGRTTLQKYSHLLVATVALVAAIGCGKTENGASDSASAASSTPAVSSVACASDNGGITLPDGFCATIFADTLGHARHLVAAPSGAVYVNTWSGSYYSGPTHAGGFLVALRDTNNDGKADIIKRFGPTASENNGGGTGIGLFSGGLYAEEGDSSAKRIVRYAISTDSMTPSGTGSQIVVNGLPAKGDHPMHPFVITSGGDIYMDVGSATNSCQVKNRTLNSPGNKPCTELQTRGGIWRYDANKTNQKFSPAERYATGIRNAVGIALDGSGQLYSTMHGRDQLYDNWPKIYTSTQGQNLPAEELLRIEKGADYGWPYCYYDNVQQKLVQAPEYGGDGKKVGDCGSKKGPEAFFPAHWAPDGLLIYTGTQFPAHYQNGAFVAFHGSWNRAPGPQQGYLVAFVPFNGGKPADPSKYEIFADGFAGGTKDPDRAAHRPTGLAQGPDGALYIADDKGGRVWKVVYKGSAK
ncbi:MAG TPA: PQQ-dependent sugar dehydrogenase [Gemmatimonadaceae bacterium]|jgi:glucose/arabinose dehydrogenase|nr:PQQ-dependent sugar dehydrogenase [Gemmatimonadaceae bacterium]